MGQAERKPYFFLPRHCTLPLGRAKLDPAACSWSFRARDRVRNQIRPPKHSYPEHQDGDTQLFPEDGCVQDIAKLPQRLWAFVDGLGRCRPGQPRLCRRIRAGRSGITKADGVAEGTRRRRQAKSHHLAADARGPTARQRFPPGRPPAAPGQSLDGGWAESGGRSSWASRSRWMAARGEVPVRRGCEGHRLGAWAGRKHPRGWAGDVKPRRARQELAGRGLLFLLSTGEEHGEQMACKKNSCILVITISVPAARQAPFPGATGPSNWGRGPRGGCVSLGESLVVWCHRPCPCPSMSWWVFSGGVPHGHAGTRPTLYPSGARHWEAEHLHKRQPTPRPNNPLPRPQHSSTSQAAAVKQHKTQLHPLPSLAQTIHLSTQPPTASPTAAPRFVAPPTLHPHQASLLASLQTIVPPHPQRNTPRQHKNMSGLQSSGRGGAGNIVDSSKTQPIQPQDLQTPTLKTSMVTTGRGGTGNFAVGLDADEKRRRQDVVP